jgi:hypothetical protein
VSASDLPARILERIDGAVRAGVVPQIVLDLDGTLLDNVPRTKAILLDGVRHLFGEGHPLEARIAETPEAEFEYAPVDTLRRHGVSDEATLEALREEWASRFFGSGYLAHDLPLAGAVDAVRAWWARGAELSYLTGRHAPEMFPGTAGSLAGAGFPIGVVRTQLLMKPDFELEDVAFKVGMAPSLERKGPVVLVVDNDPRVLNSLAAALPGAIAVMVRTLRPKDAPVPNADILQIEDFRALV